MVKIRYIKCDSIGKKNKSKCSVTPPSLSLDADIDLDGRYASLSKPDRGVVLPILNTSVSSVPVCTLRRSDKLVEMLICQSLRGHPQGSILPGIQGSWKSKG